MNIINNQTSKQTIDQYDIKENGMTYDEWKKGIRYQYIMGYVCNHEFQNYGKEITDKMRHATAIAAMAGETPHLSDLSDLIWIWNREYPEDIGRFDIFDFRSDDFIFWKEAA